MRLTIPAVALLMAAIVALCGAAADETDGYTAFNDDGFHAGAADLSPSERAGREIWYKATAGNDRFHTYVFQQRMGILIDWWRVLRSDKRDERFNIWGLVNNPGCCRPGSNGCPAKSYEETYGFDWCYGDAELLPFVGKPGYRDPACDFQDAPTDDPADRRADSCYLAFGTSTGAMGLRKFPNPRFEPTRWRELNGGTLGTWDGYSSTISQDPSRADYRSRRLADGSVEPPFLIGMACGACHIAFDPANPPKDTANPRWENLRGTVGNQYTRMSELMVSGMSPDSLQWQVFSHTRPGAVDTSAVPTDQINNPGTMNALVNLVQRPVFDDELVDRWRATDACAADANDRSCWCEPDNPGKCWERSARPQTVHHILKGGGDSVGADLAVQRVYINIGSCSEQCWLNHLTDLYQMDSAQRNFGQTPFDIGQCRRDCPNFRAIEDRAGNIVNFLFSREGYSTPLWQAQGLEDLGDWIDALEAEYGPGKVARGRQVFAENCARCHSSQQGPVDTRDFHQASKRAGVNQDWLGNDVSTPVSEVGTYGCRALHSNHMKGHIWEEFASETYRAKPPDANLNDATGGGRGYYRNVSLVDLWAHAPFMHNNAIGPELCGKPADPADEFYRSPYVDASGKPLSDPPGCWKYDPSVEGRYRLFLASVESLLNPDQRIPKTTLIDKPIKRAVGPKLWDGEQEKLLGIEIEIPAGTPAGLYGSFQHKALLNDLVLAVIDGDKLQDRLEQRVGRGDAAASAETISALTQAILAAPDQAVKIAGDQLPLLSRLYSTCTATVENAGHRFGEALAQDDKRALTAFLATL